MTIETLYGRIDIENKEWVLIVARDEGGRMIGMAELNNWQRADPYMGSLFVNEDARGAGIGRQLVDAAISLTRRSGKTVLNLWVSKDNEAAVRLYKQAGFLIGNDEKLMNMLHPLQQERS